MSDLVFHHLGLALKDDAAALTFLAAQGYHCGDCIHDPLQNVRLRFCTAPDRPAIELVMPGGEGPSPVDSIVSRFNEMIYHTCYETTDVEAIIRGWKQLQLKVLTVIGRRPAVLFGGRHVSFHRIQGVGVIELLEPT